MSTTEKDAQRDDLRKRIVEAARDIVGDEGLDALSMRALAARIGHSPGTIYLHFQDKEELLRSVMTEGFRRLGEVMERELGVMPADATAIERYAATGRAYARFAVENTGYFRAMFQMPRVPALAGCPAVAADLTAMHEGSKSVVVSLVREAAAAGQVSVADPERAAVVGWGLIHGLTSLYVSGHLGAQARTHEEFMDLVENAIEALRLGWRPRPEVTGERGAA